MSDKELIEHILSVLGGVDQKLNVARGAVADEHLNSAWSDVAGLAIMIRNHLRSTEPPPTQQRE